LENCIIVIKYSNQMYKKREKCSRKIYIETNYGKIYKALSGSIMKADWTIMTAL